MDTNHKYIYTESGEKISGLLLIKPSIFYDERGFFLESGNKKIIDHSVVEVVTFSFPSFFSFKVIIPPME